MKGVSPNKDESRADQPSSPEHHTKIPTPMKTAQSPRGGQTRFGFSPRTNSGSVHKENSFEGEALSSSESLDGRFASPPPPHRGDGAAQPEDAPSVSSGYNSDDVTSVHVESKPQASAAADPPSSGGPAGHKYDPRQYQDQQNDFHPVSKLPMVSFQMTYI